MKKAEKILVLIAVLAFALSFTTITGRNLLMILVFMILSMLYFYLGFAIFNSIGFRQIFKKASYKNISQLKIIGAVGTGISLSLTLIGILFKTMFWTGSYIILVFGILSLSIISIILLVKHINQKSNYSTKILIRSMLFGLIALGLLIIDNSKLVEIRHRNEPAYRDALINTIKYPDNVEYQKKFEEENQKRMQE